MPAALPAAARRRRGIGPKVRPRRLHFARALALAWLRDGGSAVATITTLFLPVSVRRRAVGSTQTGQGAARSHPWISGTAKSTKIFGRRCAPFWPSSGHKSPSLQGEMGRPTAQAREWQALLIEQGYAARTIPRQYGGYGGEPDVLKSVIVDQEFDQAGVSKGLSGQGISMLVPTLLELGTEEQKQRWIRADHHRRDLLGVRAIQSRMPAATWPQPAKPAPMSRGDEFVINGQKIWTSSAHFSDYDVRAGAHRGRRAQLGISYPAAADDDTGIEVRPLVTMTGDATFNEVFFTDVRLKTDQIVARRGDGWMVANATLEA